MKLFSKNHEMGGFTLIEMMVVISILAVLGSIFMNSGYSQNKIRNALLTDSEDLSITVSDMQNRTSSFVMQNKVSDVVGYGVYIDTANASKIETFYKIKDSNFSSTEIASGRQTPDSDLILTEGNHIGRICLNGCSTKTVSQAVIYFVKPKTYSNVSFNDGSGYVSLFNNISINHTCLEIAPPSGTDLRHVDIYYIGQVSSGFGPCQN
ncbi:MAG: prepilin-type N-terminal cleavage/methylation domain-containing protein [Candidatus Nomurabacteria bacterium]